MFDLTFFAIVVSVVCFVWALFVTIKLFSPNVILIATAEFNRMKQIISQSGVILENREQEIQTLKSEIKVLKDDLAHKKEVLAGENDQRLDKTMSELDQKTKRIEDLTAQFDTNARLLREKEQEVLKLTDELKRATAVSQGPGSAKGVKLYPDMSSEIEDLRNGLQAKEELLAAKEHEASELAEKISNMQKEYVSGDDSSLKQEIVELTETLRKKESDLNEAKDSVNQQGQEIMSLREQLMGEGDSALRDEINRLREEVSQKTQLLDSEASESDRLKHEISVLREELEVTPKKEKSASDVQFEGQPEEISLIMKRKEEELLAKQIEIENLTSDLNVLREEREEWERTRVVSDVDKERIDKLQAEITVLQDTVKELKTEVVSRDGEIDKLKLEISEREAFFYETDQLKTQVSELSGQLEEKTKALDESAERLEKMRKELEWVNEGKLKAEMKASGLTDMQSKAETLTDQLNAKQSEIDDLNLKVLKLNEIRVKAEADKDRVAYLENMLSESNRKAEAAAVELKNRAEDLIKAKTELDELRAIKVESDIAKKELEELKAGSASKDSIISTSSAKIEELERSLSSANITASQVEALRKENLDLKDRVTQARAESEMKTNESRGAQLQVQILNSELLRVMDEKNKLGLGQAEVEGLKQKVEMLDRELGLSRSQLAEAEGDIARMKALESQLAHKDSEISAKQEEIEGIKNSLRVQNISLDKLKSTETVLNQLEASVADQKKMAEGIKKRLEESWSKMAMLCSKTKGNVDAVSAFAGGKEFEEIRKSVYIDELISRYEKEINELRSQIEDLKK